MPETRKKYHSYIIWLYNQKKENVLPESFRKQIPHSTASTWRSINFDDYIGHEHVQIQKEVLDYIELFEKHQKLKKIMLTISKVWINVHKCVNPILQKEVHNNEILVNSIQQLSSVITTSSACNIFKISRATFHARLAHLKYKCDESIITRCFKRNPLQLTIKEIQTIKDAFSNEDFKCWPAISIYYKLLRDKKLNISKSTFYKYVKILNLQRKWKKPQNKFIGIVSTKPNEYLHVDTTYWKLMDGKKAGIVFVSDNFSKAILGWGITLGNSSINVFNALKLAMNSILEYHPNHPTTVNLIADGGAENHALSIEQLLKNCENPEFNKVIAQKDIVFSNSSIEAVNKIMKRYLRFYKPDTLDKLLNKIPIIIHDYMHLRPHGSLNGRTPFEAYTLYEMNNNFSDQIKQARTFRINQNKQMNCLICS